MYVNTEQLARGSTKAQWPGFEPAAWSYGLHAQHPNHSATKPHRYELCVWFSSDSTGLSSLLRALSRLGQKGNNSIIPQYHMHNMGTTSRNSGGHQYLCPPLHILKDPLPRHPRLWLQCRLVQCTEWLFICTICNIELRMTITSSHREGLGGLSSNEIQWQGANLFSSTFQDLNFTSMFPYFSRKHGKRGQPSQLRTVARTVKT